MRTQDYTIRTNTIHIWTLLIASILIFTPFQQANAVFHHVNGCTSCHDFFNFGAKNKSLLFETIATPNSGPKSVVFTSTTGLHSYADGDSVYDGICEVCHTQTRHHTNDGHDNTSHYDGEQCTSCHSHGNQFSAPYVRSHSIHLENENMVCTDCHSDPAQFNPTLFADGQTFDATTVCGKCHIPGGDYDGVNDPVVGAKTNWLNGVYDENHKLRPGKENWCLGCHAMTNHYNGPQCAQCHLHGTGFSGSFARSHNIHLNNENMTCSDCHIDPIQLSPAIFKDGLAFEATEVCGACHNSTGSIDGVNDPVIGAKTNWMDGVYDADRNLLPGKENWCTGCHLKTNHYDGVPCAQCHLHGDQLGTFQVESHNMHINVGNMKCSDCHTNPFQFNPTVFADGQVLENTTVCGSCHSPGGAYDGVNDPVIGAKSNWTDGVYDSNNKLLPGKEIWCAGCHDSRTTSHARNSAGKWCQDCHSRSPFHGSRSR